MHSSEGQWECHLVTAALMNNITTIYIAITALWSAVGKVRNTKAQCHVLHIAPLFVHSLHMLPYQPQKTESRRAGDHAPYNIQMKFAQQAGHP